MAQWHYHLYLILLCTGQFSVIDGTKLLPSANQQHFANILQSGKPSLIYFKRITNPSVSLFLQQLELSSESLEEYGITVAQVDCTTENVPKYCENNHVLKEAYLFRGNIMLRSFAVDVLFDVDAIVANVLFVLLFNEIKYVSSSVELHDIENEMKGRGDVIVTFVRAIGVPEHRAIMETAFVYGAKYQFVLTTEQSVLEDLELEDSDRLSARLWFCHCKMVLGRTQPCKRSLFEQPLTTVNIHSYLKVLEAPLVMELSVGPEEVSTVHMQLKMPVVFLFTQRETYEHDRQTAESVAWQLLGKAGVVLVPRAQLQSSVANDVTVGFRPAGGDSTISYLVITSVEEIIDLIKSEGTEVPTTQNDDEDESEELDFRGVQDDEVAETFHQNTWRELDLDLIPALTDKSFPQSLLATSHVVVLFYTAWDAVSMVFLRSYVEVSTRLADLKDLLLARVNCGDWPHVCSTENATQLPAVKLYSLGKYPLFYTGMLGAQSLLEFIMLSRIVNPVQLTTPEDVEAFLNGESQGDLKPYQHLSVVGLFNPDMEKEIDAFTKAANSLRGSVIPGSYVGNDNPYLRKTQVGKEILQIYLNYLPQLPALILVQLNSGSRVFAFPEDQVISRVNVLSWLKKVQMGLEQPNNVLQDKKWTPPQTAYDFLAMMDVVSPGFAKQRTPNSAKRDAASEGEDEAEVTSDVDEAKDRIESAAEPERETLPEMLNRPTAQDSKTQQKVHSEL
ncbi:thioredoxin domain-containing protein 16 isoform X2 [Rhinoraja longicauda]